MSIIMSQPIVPLTIPQSHRFEKKSRNDILMKIHLGKTEVTFFQSVNPEVMETILDKVLYYDHPTQWFRSSLLGMRKNRHASGDWFTRLSCQKSIQSGSLFRLGLSLLRRSKRPVQSSLLRWTGILVIV